MKFSFRHVFNLVVVILLIIYVGTAMGYNREARLMPLAVSIPILFLAIWQTIIEFRGQAEGRSKKKKAEDSTREAEVGGRFSKELNIFLWVVSVFISFYLFGFIITTFLYTFLWLKVHSRFSWRASLGVSIGSLAFLYIIMIYGLKVDLYSGSVIIMLRKFFYGY